MSCVGSCAMALKIDAAVKMTVPAAKRLRGP